MVQLHVKRGDESQFLFNTTTDAPLESLIQQVTAIYNGRLKVDRICSGKTLSPLLPVLSVKDPHPTLPCYCEVLKQFYSCVQFYAIYQHKVNCLTVIEMFYKWKN